MSTKLQDVSRKLGHILEFSADYTPTDYIDLSAGFTYMTGSKTMEYLKRASSDGSLRWAWITLTINPRLLNLKW